MWQIIQNTKLYKDNTITPNSTTVRQLWALRKAELSDRCEGNTITPKSTTVRQLSFKKYTGLWIEAAKFCQLFNNFSTRVRWI